MEPAVGRFLLEQGVELWMMSLMGTGMGLIQTPVTATVTRIVPAEQMGVATGICHMGRFVAARSAAPCSG